MEVGETVEAATAREVLEETNLRLDRSGMHHHFPLYFRVFQSIILKASFNFKDVCHRVKLSTVLHHHRLLTSIFMAKSMSICPLSHSTLNGITFPTLYHRLDHYFILKIDLLHFIQHGTLSHLFGSPKGQEKAHSQRCLPLHS